MFDGFDKLPLYSHSVTLDPDKCKGCTNCIKGCPTEAIRVRKGRATIMEYRCIDCGECIRNCPYRAKKALSDPLDIIFKYDWKVAIPAPALYGQFDTKYSLGTLLSGLTLIGFDEVYEVSASADAMTTATQIELNRVASGAGERELPSISSSCPAVLRYIQIRYPSLLEAVLPLISPMEHAARTVKARLQETRKNVGVFFISPCAAKVTDVRSPLGTVSSSVDGVIAIKDIYLQLRAALSKVGTEIKPQGTAAGISWARAEGEAEAVGEKRRITVDGMDQVMAVLEAAENGKLKDVSFIEAMACKSGCIGGPLCVEAPFIAKANIRSQAEKYTLLEPELGESAVNVHWTEQVKPRREDLFSTDMNEALTMEAAMEDMIASLPGLDCGSCGAPTCRALAEDIVRGKALKNDCVFKLRESVRKLAAEMFELEQINPPGLDRGG